MRTRNRLTSGDSLPELDLTPMLDVVFIMLIFFIVTSVFVKEPGLDVTRPAVEQMEQRNPSVIVAVAPDNTVWVDRAPYTVTNVRPVLEGLRDENPRLEIVLQGDVTASVGTTMQVQSIIENLGIPVYMSTEAR